ncbi:MAG: hypothetical protein CMH81_01215 [Nitrospiraceae bacterium]|nr:hypothetical protein [Nitrospiraceae bacterium]
MSENFNSLDVDVLFVGGGPASLAGALHLTKLVARSNERIAAGALRDRKLEPQIAIIEKGRDVGAHAISGALFDPRALEELMPDYAKQEFPFPVTATAHEVHYLTTEHAYQIPPWVIPPAYRSTGCYVGSLQKLNLWLAQQVEDAGVHLFNETCGTKVLYDNDYVCGVLTGEKGLDSDGGRKANYEPGTRIQAKITVFGEGPRGTLAEDVIHKFNLRKGKTPQSYALGVKEMIRVRNPGSPGLAIHTLGYPLGSRVFGGGFCYGIDDHLYAVGIVCGLDWDDPRMDPHAQLQQLKKHPLIQQFIAGGVVVAYGAKTLPEGGVFAIPRLYTDGALLIGDSAGFLNVPYLKGIHYAMKSGMVAAETIVDALHSGNVSASALSSYESRLEGTYVIRDLHHVRNFRRMFALGFYPGLALGGLTMWTGLGPTRPGRMREDFTYLQHHENAIAKQRTHEPAQYDAGVLADKLTDVFHSGTEHREDQPSHIRIVDPSRCLTDCIPRYGDAPCTYFCPAKVYELIGQGDDLHIRVNFSNCVHCKTCVIKDPIDVSEGDGVQNIIWRAPAEGGPRYQGL